MRKREAIQPRKLYRAEVDVFPYTADSNTLSVKREEMWVPSGSESVASAQW